MPATCREIIAIMEALAPPELAAEWDNVGLLLGDPQKEVRRVLVALDVTHEVAEEAAARGANLIISHHPLFFRPWKHLRFDRSSGDLVRRLVQGDIMVYSAHTNLDAANLGVSYHLAVRLGLENIEILVPTYREKYYKLVTFVPEEAEGRVRDALGAAGAGWIGNYSHCTFRTLGTGTFLPLAGTSPYIGQEGKLEEVKEYRLETILPRERLPEVLQALINAHPYEEVAYDVYPLANEGPAQGIGRLGRLPQAVSLHEWALAVKKELGCERITVVGDPDRKIRQVAVCGGAGSEVMEKAVAKGADVLVTGDLKYHEARRALDLGLAVIDGGHFATERVIVPALVAYLQEELQEREVMVLEAQKEREPWRVL
ncbi:MAG: Nif3-like dinuclear metal center hexameric protein [Thermoanaerobacteraceae bacterium]|uniref:Nif3-like dinuclear metal center hexameric protein n=1 Tax=Thermanaeromonas sp. C210 TaxID=2731925 RepID=UPI00155C4582|nr:Nif3-like dinuclear metal center hexameric protein [Thermanaeromonas sp. C210]MBE3580161.1 Nif3-like dinuclear metal center hexameric protein [Thermoanaerobacteraceae bacterium]GFN24271.1 GTP cyclohydrolase 1 type 2 [Thermanaeromonas sp. C210]